jgi:hypothetical protein
MTFENYVVAVTAVLYITVGAIYAYKGNIPWAMVWFCYGLANVGMILASRR